MNNQQSCCSCGCSLSLERSIIELLGGDSSTRIDYCLDCINKALNTVLSQWIDRVPDTNLRHELMDKLLAASTTSMTK